MKKSLISYYHHPLEEIVKEFFDTQVQAENRLIKLRETEQMSINVVAHDVEVYETLINGEIVTKEETTLCNACHTDVPKRLFQEDFNVQTMVECPECGELMAPRPTFDGWQLFRIDQLETPSFIQSGWLLTYSVPGRHGLTPRYDYYTSNEECTQGFILLRENENVKDLRMSRVILSLEEIEESIANFIKARARDNDS